MQRVQTRSFFGFPSTMVVTFWMFGFQLLLVACKEWLTLCPN
jgi:hypothetical protein